MRRFFAGTALLSLVLAMLSGCMGDIMIDGEKYVASDSSNPSGGGDGECVSCNSGDCGLCSLDAGDNVYSCESDRPPDIPKVCNQTGSVFSGANGSYICWRC